MGDAVFQACMSPQCGARYDVADILFSCRRCGALLDVQYDWSAGLMPNHLRFFDARRGASGRSAEARANASGVWRFRELLPLAPVEDLVTIGEGRTILQRADELAASLGLKPGNLFLQYEGFNPSGSFKDNGMAAAFTAVRRLNRHRVACASTGNTSASLAMFASLTRTPHGRPFQAFVFVGGEKIAFGKLAQALDFGARTIQIDGDFDDCMRLVLESAERFNLYLMNSVNPFRLEGQKTIMYRVLEGLDWEVPDWIVVPGGNLGNTSAFGKAFAELRELNLISRIPRLAVINAQGANTLHVLYNEMGIRYRGGAIDAAAVEGHYRRMRAEGRAAQTVASAIAIARPVNLAKALRSLEAMNGLVREVSDGEILDGKAMVGRFGFGCEPAGGATIAGLRRLLEEKTISRDDRVVCILTGHALKDAEATVAYHGRGPTDSPPGVYANAPVRLPADIEAIGRFLESSP